MERNFYATRLFPCWVMASQQPFKDDVGGAALLDAMNNAVARAHFKEVRPFTFTFTLTFNFTFTLLICLLTVYTVFLVSNVFFLYSFPGFRALTLPRKKKTNLVFALSLLPLLLLSMPLLLIPTIVFFFPPHHGCSRQYKKASQKKVRYVGIHSQITR